jgi:hypothetical protein
MAEFAPMPTCEGQNGNDGKRRILFQHAQRVFQVL